MKKLLLLGLALACVSAAMAYPTLSGTTGLVALPTAETVAAGQFGAAIDWYDTEGDAIVPIRAV